jgi:diguanylate cyclase (GGDEF)-like protein
VPLPRSGFLQYRGIRTSTTRYQKSLPGLPVPVTLAVELGTRSQLTASRAGTLRALRRTQMQASTDSLTGLVNRRTLEEHVRKLNDRGQSYAFILCDVDHFKKLNDNHGHQAGDMALRLFAEALRGAMRSDDLPARWGGEEFVMVLARCNAQQALEAAQPVQAALPHALLGATVPAFSVSSGIADTTMAMELDELSRLADNALYQAKEQGRDRAAGASGSGRALTAHWRQS